MTFGRPYSRQELLSLSDTYRRWVMGFPAWPWLNIPFTPFGNAMKARETMISHFQDATDEGRARLARGEECPGLLGNLLNAVDEEGNRWVKWWLVCVCLVVRGDGRQKRGVCCGLDDY